jgi:CRISPR-associated protein (TIGR02710 family)
MTAELPRHTLLICTVGGAHEPLVTSLLHWKPARVVFLPSSRTTTNVDTILRAFAEHAGHPLNPGCYEIKPIRDAEDLAGCLRLIRSLDDDVNAWLARGSDYQLVADFTAGTKCMSAALALQARRWPCRYSYIGGARRTKEGTGVVESGSERILHSANPWDALGYQAVEDYALLFSQMAYDSAARLAETAKRRMTGTRKREFQALHLLAEAYEAWDRFDHTSALTKLHDLAKYHNDLPPALGAHRAAILREDVQRHLQTLYDLLQAPAPSLAQIRDLLANARRCHTRGRLDDAVARLYRAIEAVAQLRLAAEHEIPSSKSVPLDRIPPPLRHQWTSRAHENTVSLGLQDAYELLRALGDDLGARFHTAGLDDNRRSPLSARNQSILAHGFQPVSDDTFQALWSAALSLSDTREDQLPVFPTLASPG